MGIVFVETPDDRDNGLFDADVLADALANLDASETAIELRGGLAD
ncbi:hypothetical protein [Frigoribacterium sp. PhB24]|nr:hypothetical protein [Frigoribacterium sp. PhB24]ROS49528.1 hypothetical protein EDF50_2443 [Frigoribacterium sp. PhB24]